MLPVRLALYPRGWCKLLRFEGAVRRLSAAVAAGADIGFLEDITTAEEAREVWKQLAPTSMLLDMVEQGATSSWTHAEAKELVFKVIISTFLLSGLLL